MATIYKKQDIYEHTSAFRSHMIIHMILYSCKSILLYIVCYSAFFKNLRICSAKFGNSMSVWTHVTDRMRYLENGVWHVRRCNIVCGNICVVYRNIYGLKHIFVD